MTWTRDPIAARCKHRPEWNGRIRIRGRVVHVHVARIPRCTKDGRLYHRGWYARIYGCGGTHQRIMAYYADIEDRFGSGVHGVRGYGRTREEAVAFLRRALLRGWLGSGVLYAPPQFDDSYISEYNL